MTDSTTPAPAAESQPASGGQLSMEQHRTEVQWGLDNGKIDRARAEQEMQLAGNTLPLDFAKSQPIDEALAQAGDPTTLPGFEPAKAVSEYSFPDPSELNKVLTADKNGQNGVGISTAETMEIQNRVGGWLMEGKLPPQIGSAIGNMAAKHMAAMPNYAKMTEPARESYRLFEQSKLDRLWGDKAPQNIALAKQLVQEIEAKRPGLVDFLERTGLGNHGQVIAQLAAHARRLAARAK